MVDVIYLEGEGRPVRGLAIVLVTLALAACANQRAEKQLAAIEAACAVQEPDAPGAYRHCVLRKSYLATAAQQQLSVQSTETARSIETQLETCLSAARLTRLEDDTMIPLDPPTPWAVLEAQALDSFDEAPTPRERQQRVAVLKEAVTRVFVFVKMENCHERAVAEYVDWAPVLQQQDPAVSIAISSAAAASAAAANAASSQRIEQELKRQRDLCYMRQGMPC